MSERQPGSQTVATGFMFRGRRGFLDVVWCCDDPPATVRTAGDCIEWMARIECAVEWLSLLLTSQQRAEWN